MKYIIGWFSRIFAQHATFSALYLSEDKLKLKRELNAYTEIYHLNVNENLVLDEGVFWSTLSFNLENGDEIKVGGIKKSDGLFLFTQIKKVIANTQNQYIENIKPVVFEAGLLALELSNSHSYLRKKQIKAWFNKYQSHSLVSLTSSNILKQKLDKDHHRFVILLSTIFKDGTDYFERRNKTFISNELDRFKTYFDNIESKPLTTKQREACVINEQNNLVLAGAGTGKTSTMIGRAGYLITSKQALPSEILMLAYGSDAAKEMAERIEKRLNTKLLTVKTFHSFGKEVITKVEGVVPSINKMAEDSLLKTRFVDDQFQKLLTENRDYRAKIIEYFLNHAYAYQTIFNFKTIVDYHQYIQENEIRTLKGEQVKSMEECEIANYLFRQGVKYEYEANYKINTSGPDFKAYQPDFYLPEEDIYIEHFAIDENGNTPIFIDQIKYVEGIEWKRGLHQKHGTTLLETYSYQKKKGNLTNNLKSALMEQGVKFNPIPENKLLDELNKQGVISTFSRLLADLLSLIKSTLVNISNLYDDIQSRKLSQHIVAAFDLFRPVYDAYQVELQKTNTIDFDDMIGKAISYVESGQYQSPFTHILVDEFQDISKIRARLTKAIISQKKNGTVFCVGDDWQSIYRFTGSDISITKNFSDFFGDTATSVLDLTFRFNNKISEAASKFVSKNPSQIKKSIASFNETNQPALSLLKTPKINNGARAALQLISDNTKNKASVLILVRFKHDIKDLSSLKQNNPKLDIKIMTTHAAKGKEADYVIVVGLNRGKYGFPSEKRTHSLLELLLPESEEFKHAEERRLFYVALTRARHHVYLITNGDNPSLFVRELIKDKYDLLNPQPLGYSLQKVIANIECPSCNDGYIFKRASSFGQFSACTNYPLCKHTQPDCIRCGGTLKTIDRFRVCNETGCNFIQPLCPQCNGIMKLRKGPRGNHFWGCNHYNSSAEFSCSHTEKYIDLKQAKLLM